ncbi:MAG: hypothetical protein RL021_2028 [Bacteroidota bacterium]
MNQTKLLSDSLLRRIYDSSPDRLWCIDEEYRLLDMNESCRRFLQEVLGMEAFIGMNILDLLKDEGALIYWKDLYARALRGEPITTRQFHLENGKNVGTELQLLPVRNLEGTVIAVACTSRNVEIDPQTEKRELVRNILFKTTLQNSRDAICAFDIEGRYIAFNTRHSRMVQRFYNVKLQTGMRPDEFLKGTAVFEQLRKDRERALSGEFFTDVLPFEVSPGQLGFLELFHAPLVNEMGQVAGYSIVFRDVTEKHRRELQFKRLTLSELRERKLRYAELSRITEERQRQKEEVLLATVRSLENERSRIANDLHDDLGPGLSKISSLLQVLLSDTSMNPVGREALGRALDNANEAQKSISEIIWSMNPKNNELPELVAYLRHYAGLYFENSGIRFKFSSPANLPSCPLDGMTRRNLFLIVKESLNNILKHSGAEHAKLEIWLERFSNNDPLASDLPDAAEIPQDPEPTLVSPAPLLLRIVITDDGKGFDLDNTTPFRNGLGNMRKRAEAIGGMLELTSRIGEGSTLRFEMKIGSR